ncbi:MAG: M23 family metallopeptidase, partial [Rhodoplanes sp.]
AAVAPAAEPKSAPAVAPAAPSPAPRIAEAPAPAPQKPAQAPQKLASIDPTPAVRMATPTTEIEAEEAPTNRNGELAFRWPVRGRVIANFGAKTNGQQNDGINLAVPEGTAVRAAEDGVVAYAGNELKGYGNLILIRHSNGFVTAYAHASEIMVKRNDKVRRGQVIAKSGQTGTVASPQLHFEIRKGSSPIDPMQHLPAGA